MKVIKVIAGILVALVLVAVVGVTVMKGKATERLARTWEVKGKDLPVPWPLSDADIAALREQKRAELAAKPAADAAPPAGEAVPGEADPLAGVDLGVIAKDRALARGKHLMEARVGCTDCHGKDFGGAVIFDAPPMGVFAGPNITAGGVTKGFTPADWDRIIRHGINHKGTSTTMPAIDFMGLSDQELSDIITFITAQPPVDRPSIENTIGPIRGVLLANGTIPISAELINHTATLPTLPPEAAPDVTFGKHVAGACVGCHRLNFAGGPVPGGDPSWPEAANLSPDDSGLKGWSAADFKRALREGKSRDGRALLPPMTMAVEATKHLSDVEIDAMYAYLQTVSPVKMGTPAN